MAEHRLEGPQAISTGEAWRWEKIISLGLLFILLASATTGVGQVLAGADLGSLWKSLLPGLLIGWALALLRYRAWKSVVIILTAGIIFNLLTAGGLAKPTSSVMGEVVHIPTHILTAPGIGSVDWAELSQAASSATKATGVVMGRIGAWLGALVAGRAAFDPVAAGFTWSILLWVAAAWAGWVVEATRKALLAVLPTLILSLGTLSYGQSGSTSIYIVLAATLILVAIVQYGQHEWEWDRRQVAYPRRKSRQISSMAIVITLLLVGLAAFLSSISLQRLEQWTAELTRPSGQGQSGLAKSLGVRKPTATPDAFTSIRSPGLPRDKLIGAGPELLGELVMSVEVKDLSVILQGREVPLYWRSLTYDNYTGHGWSTSNTEEKTTPAGGSIQSSPLADHLLVRQVMRMVPEASGLVYAAGEPQSASVPTRSAWRSSNDMFGLETGSTSYEIQSLVPYIDERDLRAAGQDYPAWITQRYLRLPAEVPARVRELAIQLTASEPGTYDRARALETYLRTYEYSLDVTRPPSNQDLVDYFLFNLRKGYCDYYASAMVVMARAAGIPARLAIGFASGTYNLNLKRFMVTQAEAHSWPELYFPGIGWVPFEPTASRPVIGGLKNPNPGASPTPPAPLETGGTTSTTLPRYIGLAGLLLLLLGGFGWAIFDEVYLRQQAPRRAAAEIYRRMKRYGNALGVDDNAGRTPFEYTQALCFGLQYISPGDGAGVGRDTVREVQSIMGEIVRLIYRPTEDQDKAKVHILSEWRTMRWHLRRMWILRWWKEMRALIHNWMLKAAGQSSEQV